MDLAMPTTRHSIQKPSLTLGYFIVGSLVLHALLVGLWQGKTPAGPSANSTFQITVLAHRGETGHKSRNAERVAAPASTPPPVTALTKTRSAARPQTIAKISDIKPGKQESLIKIETPRVTNVTPSRIQQKRVIARTGEASNGRHKLTAAAKYRKIRTALQEALLPRFDYPPLARRRGWQGRVNVALHVEADGDLTRIHLAESSGHALLDQTAVRNVTELRSVPLVAQWLEGTGMDLVLPVRYQLAD